MVVDFHSHYLPPSHAAALRDCRGGSEASDLGVAAVLARESALVELDARLELMDLAGIDLSVLSVPPPGPHCRTGAGVVSLAGRINDELVEACLPRPERYAALISLPLPNVAASLAELDRVGDLDLVWGVELITNASGWLLDDPSFEDVYAACAERGLLVMLHPGLEELPAAYSDWALSVAVGAPVSSSVGALRLMLSGMLDRVGGLTPVVPHLGGVLPYLAQRVVDQCGCGAAAHDPLHYMQTRLLFDTCSYHRPALSCAVETVGAERLLMGSDFPFRGSPGRAVEDIGASGLSPEQRRHVLGAGAALLSPAVERRAARAR